MGSRLIWNMDSIHFTHKNNKKTYSTRNLKQVLVVKLYTMI